MPWERDTKGTTLEALTPLTAICTSGLAVMNAWAHAPAMLTIVSEPETLIVPDRLEPAELEPVELLLEVPPEQPVSARTAIASAARTAATIHLLSFTLELPFVTVSAAAWPHQRQMCISGKPRGDAGRSGYTVVNSGTRTLKSCKTYYSALVRLP